MNELAIIIPAFKETYFDKALCSLSEQTNKNFTVYIGDDCSPSDLKSIAAKYAAKLDIVYNRFSNNTGAKDLVLQWKRCIDLTKGEKWLWLFSDDDVMDKCCVENFFLTKQAKNDRFDVYRFNTVTIDGNGNVIHTNHVGPEEESSEQMAYHLLKVERGNSMPDHVFSRNIYNACGGFVYTDYAQGADWATSILFSKNKGMCIIPGANVYWRYSGTNISSIVANKRNEMIKGHLQFLKWVLAHFMYLKSVNYSISYAQILSAVKINFRVVMINHFKGFEFSKCLFLYEFLHKELNMPAYSCFKELISIKSHSNLPLSLIIKTKRFLNKK